MGVDGNLGVFGGFGGPKVFIGLPVMPSGQLDGLTFSGGDSASFDKSGVAPGPQPGGFGWTLQFHPTSLGPHEVTLSFIKFTGPMCSPNSFKARGVGVSP